MATLALRAYAGSNPNGTTLGDLTDAYAKRIVVECNALGGGSLSIHPDSAQAGWVAPGNYVRAWRNTVSGPAIAGFWIDSGGDTVVSTDEKGGQEYARGGRGPIAILRKAIVWHRSVLSAEPDEPLTQPGRGRWHWADAQPAAVLIRLLKEAQARGDLISAVTWDFTRTHDSDGNAWDADLKGRWNVPIGKSLLEVVGAVREVDLRVECSPDFVVSAWPEEYGTDRSATVDFTEADNIRDTSTREVRATRAAGVALVMGEDDDGHASYEVVTDSSITADLGERIETFVPYERSDKPAALRRAGRRRLRRYKRQWDGPLTLGVLDTTGRVALVNYTAGDTVEIHIPGIYNHHDERLMSVTLEETENGEYDPILGFGDLGANIMGFDLAGESGSAGVGTGGGGTTGGGGQGGGGHSGGGSTPPPIDATNTGEYLIEDWTGPTGGYPGVVADQTTVLSGTTHSLILSLPGLDEIDPTRWLWIGYSLAHADAAGTVPAQLVAAGFTALETDLNRGSNSAGVFVQQLDGTQTYEATGNALEITIPSPGGTGIWYVALVEGVSQWTHSEDASGGGNSGAVSGWAGEHEIALILDTGNAALSGTVSAPYSHLENLAAGGAALGITTADITGAFNPPSFTHSGTAEYAVTSAGRYTDPGWGRTLRGRGVETDAPWDGGNTWDTGVDQGAAAFTTTGTKGVITITTNNTQAYARLASDSADDPNGQSWGVWADGDGTLRCKVQVNRLGVLTDTFPNILWWQVQSPGYTARFLVHLGDAVVRGYMTTGTRGVAISQGPELTPTVTDLVPKGLAAATDYQVRMDFQGDRCRMRLWADGVNEPVAWDVDTAKVGDEDVGEIGTFTMYLWGGSNTGNLAASYDSLWGALSGAEGTAGGGRVVLPRGDGTTVTWVIGTYPAGRLHVYVDGLLTKPSAEDPTGGSFTLSRAPSRGAWMEYEIA